MKTITITATTSKGTNAIKTHLAEYKKKSFKDKLIFKTAGFNQEVVSEDPLTLELIVNNRHISNPHYLIMVTDQIKEALKSNGATSTDYELKVQ